VQGQSISIAARAILNTLANLRAKGIPPEDVTDALVILGANEMVELMGAEFTARFLEEMAEELRAAIH
jgi:hypothetical protein